MVIAAIRNDKELEDKDIKENIAFRKKSVFFCIFNRRRRFFEMATGYRTKIKSDQRIFDLFPFCKYCD